MYQGASQVTLSDTSHVHERASSYQRMRIACSFPASKRTNISLLFLMGKYSTDRALESGMLAYDPRFTKAVADESAHASETYHTAANVLFVVK